MVATVLIEGLLAQNTLRQFNASLRKSPDALQHVLDQTS
jgi:hypothetical protein